MGNCYFDSLNWMYADTSDRVMVAFILYYYAVIKPNIVCNTTNFDRKPVERLQWILTMAQYFSGERLKKKTSSSR